MIKNTERNLMYRFVGKIRPNPLGGDCYGCIYCYIHGPKGMRKRIPRLKEKYSGDFRLYPGKLKEMIKLKSDKPCFFCDSIDYLHRNNPDENVLEIWDAIKRNRNVIFISVTKNPGRYNNLIEYIPKNMILGFTLESNLSYPFISKAPDQQDRISELIALVDMMEYYNLKNELFASIEPVLKFELFRFRDIIKRINPKFGIAIGYDNHNNRLPEPSLKDTLALRDILKKEGFNVIDKTLRKAWWE